MARPTGTAHDLTPELLSMTCKQFKNGQWRKITDVVTPEIRVHLNISGQPHAKLWAYPEALEDLALGHALLDHCPPGHCPSIESQNEFEFNLSVGKAQNSVPIPPVTNLAPAQVLIAMNTFLEADGRWDATGCFHRAAIFDPKEKRFIHQVEDIGRHNCVDRLAGWSLRTGTPLQGHYLFISARATASLVRKIAKTGVSAVITRAAVTTAGLEVAKQARLTLAGFARVVRFTIFTDSQGLLEQEA